MEKLKNLGPKCEPLLKKAGITTRAQLEKLGTEEAFLRIWEANGGRCYPHAMFLYALEGAIYNINCLEVPKERQEALKKFMEAFRNSLL